MGNPDQDSKRGHGHESICAVISLIKLEHIDIRRRHCASQQKFNISRADA